MTIPPSVFVLFHTRACGGGVEVFKSLSRAVSNRKDWCYGDSSEELYSCRLVRADVDMGEPRAAGTKPKPPRERRSDAV